MKYERPQLITLSDFSHHVCYGFFCSPGADPTDVGQKCEAGLSAGGLCADGSAPSACGAGGTK